MEQLSIVFENLASAVASAIAAGCPVETPEVDSAYSALKTAQQASTLPAEIEALIASATEKRAATLRMAIEAGGNLAALKRIASAVRVSKTDTIRLPAGKHENVSRGKGWCRKGTGNVAEWAERHEDGGYIVGPGKWTVGSNDGFSRKESTPWKVEHVQVGSDTWTIAN